MAFVYLAGYGVQLAGENYFMPVDANAQRDTDIPVEGLRVGDYMRQLCGIAAEGHGVRARCRARSIRLRKKASHWLVASR